MTDRIIIQARRDFMMSRKIMLIGGIEHANGLYSAFKPTELQKISGCEFLPPFMEIDHGAAQRLFDELYNIGLRPSDEQLLPEKTRDAHISDLRKIAFSVLGIK